MNWRGKTSAGIGETNRFEMQGRGKKKIVMRGVNDGKNFSEVESELGQKKSLEQVWGDDRGKMI